MRGARLWSARLGHCVKGVVCQCWTSVDADKALTDQGKGAAKSCIKDRLDTQALNAPPKRGNSTAICSRLVDFPTAGAYFFKGIGRGATCNDKIRQSQSTLCPPRPVNGYGC